MAFILKSQKLLSRLVGFTSQANVAVAPKQLTILQWKKILPVATTLKNDYSTVAAKVMSADMLDRSIHQLDLDVRYRDKVFKREIEDVLEAINQWGSVTYPQTLLLLRCCGSLSKVENPKEILKVAEKMWNVLKKLGLKFDILHYNLLLSIYIQNDHEFSPEEFLKMLEEENITPNLITYQRLLRAYCRYGNIDGASNLLEKMKSEDLPINQNIFNSLIYGHCQSGDLESATGIFDLMKQKGIEPNSESYLHLLCFHAKTGNIEEIRKIMETCEENDVVLLDKDILQVAYSLAINNYKDHIPEVMKKVKRAFGYNAHASEIIHRLLHKNLDDCGLMIYDTMLKSNNEIDTRNYGKFVIDHFVKSRPVEQLLDLCDSMEKKGTVSVPISYALKETLRNNDTNRSLALLQAMRERGFPIRSHYFWPLLIQASQVGGNHEILKMCEKMKDMKVGRCNETIGKIIFPNYSFGWDFLADIARLKEAGVDDRLISWKLFWKFLSEKKFKNAELLMNSKPIPKSPHQFIKPLVEALAIGDLEENTFVGILYGLLHEVQCKQFEKTSTEVETEKSKTEEETGISKTEEETGISKTEVEYNEEMIEITPEFYLEKILVCVMQQCKEETAAKVLQEMLLKQIGIGSELGEKILKFINTPQVQDLVKQLSSPNLQMRFDPSLIAIKKRRIHSGNAKLRRATITGNFEEAEKLWNQLGQSASPVDYANMMILCTKENNISKALELFDNLQKKLEPEKVPNDLKKLYDIFLQKLARSGNLEAVEKVFSVGKKLGIMSGTQYNFIIVALLSRNDIQKAVEYFCEKCLETRFVSGYSAVMNKLIDEGNTELIQKVTDVVTEIKGQNLSILLLLFHLADKGLVKQASKLLETPGLAVSREEFRQLCKRYFETKSTTCLETLLAVSKQNFIINRKLIYNYLARLYVEQNNIEKTKALWYQLEEENFFAYDNFKYLSDYLRSEGEDVPFLQDRENKFKALKTKRGRRSNRMEENQNINESKSLEAYSMAMKEKIQVEEAITLMQNLAFFGYVDEVVNLTEKYIEDQRHLRSVSSKYFTKKKINEYLKFLIKMTEKNPDSLKNTLLVEKLVPFVNENEKLLDKIQEVVFTQAKDLNSENSIIRVWLLNLYVPHRLSKAEEIFFNHIENSPLLLKIAPTILNHAWKFRTSIVIERILQSDMLKSKLTADMPGMYSCVISRKVFDDKLDEALTYLKKAVEEGWGDAIPQRIIHKLNRKLQQKEKNFPYPELLNKEEKTRSADVTSAEVM